MSRLIERVTCANVNCYQRLAMRVQFEDQRLCVRRSVVCIFDTGAESILLSAAALGLSKTREGELAEVACQLTHYGIESSVGVESYQYYLESIAVGNNIRLRNFPVNISFNPNLKLNLLGMPFIGLFDSFISSSNHSILLSAIEGTAPYITGTRSSHDILE